jgi:8-oxo-dGTP diphosphatase
VLIKLMYMIRVTCAIIQKGELFLACQRSVIMSMPLKWEFPGGKLEKDEDEINCIKREIKEELNVEIKIIQKLRSFTHDYTSFQIELIPFLSEIISGEIILKEHSQYQWLQKSELSELDWAAADLPIVEEILMNKFH